jgi:hypothetical protein
MQRQNAMRVSWAIALGLSFPALLPTAGAQEAAYPRERGSIVFAAFITDHDTSTQLDSDQGEGTDISLEDDLGLEGSTTVFRFGGHFWIGSRHRIDIGAFDLSRSASTRIEETIAFGDEIFEIDTVVNSDSNLTILKTDYTYALVDRDRGYFGLTGGLYIAQTKLSLSEATLGTAETEDLTAPLPLLGFRGEYYVTERFALRGVAQWFSVDTGDVEGSLRDLYLAGDYRLGRRWSVGLAYNTVTMGVHAEEDSGLQGDLDWGYDGWLAYVKFDFGT